jgi:hypothetical protein
MGQLLLLVIAVSILWMVADARQKGQSWASVIGWVFLAVCLWIIAFPYYLVARKHFGEAKATDKATDKATTTEPVSNCLDV